MFSSSKRQGGYSRAVCCFASITKSLFSMLSVDLLVLEKPGHRDGYESYLGSPMASCCGALKGMRWWLFAHGLPRNFDYERCLHRPRTAPNKPTKTNDTVVG